MKLYAASVPRSVRAARLSHLPANVIIGTWYIQNPGGANQVFDVVMQAEAEFLRTKNYLATTNMNPALQRGQADAPYVMKDIKSVEVADGDTASAIAHFRAEFKIG